MKLLWSFVLFISVMLTGVECRRGQRVAVEAAPASASIKTRSSDAQVVRFGDSAEEKNRILIDKLTENFHCPTADNSLFISADSPLHNCSQSSYGKWAFNCFKEDQMSDVSVFNQTLRILYRTAILGQKCRYPITCQWPSCQSADLITFNSNENLVQQFQQLIVDNTRVVHNFSHNDESCNEMPVELHSFEGLTKVEIITKLTKLFSEHIINGKCLQVNELAANRAALAEISNSTTNDSWYDYYLIKLYEKYSVEESGVDQKGVFAILTDVGLAIEDDDGGVEPTEPTLKQRRRRGTKNSADVLSALAAFTATHSRARRSTDNLDKCLSSSEALKTFDRNSNGSLDIDEFLQFCSYIVYQISNGNKCGSSSGGSGNYNRAEVYGYGTLAVFIISACSALGFVIIPMLSESVYEIMMTAFIALAFGTLTGDALLHMLPEALVISDNDDDQAQAFYKSLVITMSIYLLFVFEGFTHLLVRHNHSHGHEHGAGDDHGHSHTPDHKFVQKQTNKITEIPDEKKSRLDMITVPSTDILIREEKDENSTNENSQRNLQELIINDDQTPVCLGLTSLALVIIIGDAIHNVTDGISIGASFASDINTGFSTSLAVLFHELPHEFGDFVILLTTGLTLKKALIWNFISSLSAFVGLYIGIAVGENAVADQWIFSVTAGMFLYVAIADMLPEMRNIKSRKPWWAFFAQNVGALFGIGFMVFMHYLEDLIHFG